MLFFVVRLSHYCKFKVKHAFPNQSFSRSSFNHHHVLPGAYLSCAKLGRRFHAASKKKITLRECPYFFSSKAS